MIKKIVYTLSVIMLIILPLRTQALNNSINLSCDKTILSPNESTMCYINGYIDSEMMVTVKLNINAGPYLTISDIKRNSDIWNGDNATSLELYTGGEITGSFSIASFKVTAGSIANAETNVSVSNVYFGTKIGDAQNSNSSVGGKPVNIKIHTPSSDTSLKSLLINGQATSTNTLSKPITLNTESVTIQAIASDSNAKVSGDIGTFPLGYDTKTYTIIVTAENGATKQYTLNINRTDNRNTNAYLSSLSVSKGNLNKKFNRATYDYSVNVESDVESIEIRAQAEAGSSRVEGAGTKNLRLGNNTFKITVYAENESTKTYTIVVNRKDDRSTNNKLKSLTASNGEINFNPDKTEYDIAVDYEIDKISFDATPEDEKSTITGLEERELIVGENLISIEVKAENSSTKTYTIRVIRNKEVIETNENKAKSITIKGHDFPFEPDTYEYTLETRLHELDITIELNSETATYEITGNENLHDGNIVQIIITDAEGNNNIYTIKIYNPSEGIEEEGILGLQIFNLPKFVYYIIIWISILIALIMIVLVYKEKTNIKSMLHKHKHKYHQECTDEENHIDSSGLYGEPTYETLEMAKINLEDYLGEEQKINHENHLREFVPEPKTSVRDIWAEEELIVEDETSPINPDDIDFDSISSIDNDEEALSSLDTTEEIPTGEDENPTTTHEPQPEKTDTDEELSIDQAITTLEKIDFAKEVKNSEPTSDNETKKMSRTAKRAKKDLEDNNVLNIAEMFEETNSTGDIDDIINAATLTESELNNESKEEPTPQEPEDIRKKDEIKEQLEPEEPKKRAKKNTSKKNQEEKELKEEPKPTNKTTSKTTKKKTTKTTKKDSSQTSETVSKEKTTAKKTTTTKKKSKKKKK